MPDFTGYNKWLLAPQALCQTTQEQEPSSEEYVKKQDDIVDDTLPSSLSAC